MLEHSSNSSMKLRVELVNCTEKGNLEGVSSVMDLLRDRRSTALTQPGELSRLENTLNMALRIAVLKGYGDIVSYLLNLNDGLQPTQEGIQVALDSLSPRFGLSELLQKVKLLLNDYTQNNSSVSRFFHGHWNRHYIKSANELIKKIETNAVSDVRGLHYELMKMITKRKPHQKSALSQCLSLIEKEITVFSAPR